MKKLLIEVRDKIAVYNDKEPIVCGNSDYVIQFNFDDEWSAYEEKTARFISDGTYRDVVFQGDECPVPVLKNTLLCSVGVFAGDLHTTTSALVPCKKSILCKDGAPADPDSDVYHQIMQLINEGKIRGEQGEKGDKGEKGDAGSVKFVAVAELPTENIDNSVMYLVPIEGSEENRFAEYVYIDGKWEQLGTIAIQVDHSEYVKFTDYATTSKAGVTIAADSSALMNERKGTNGELPYVPSTNLSFAVKRGLINGKASWTDEEKAKACETIGAVQRQPNTSSGWNRVYGMTSTGEECVHRVANGIQANTIVIRGVNGVVMCGTPSGDNDATTKKYVDDLIAELRAEIEALKNG